jgi:FecR-like protein
MAHWVDRFARWRTDLAAVLLLGLASSAALADQQIGAAAVVVNNVTGTLATTRQPAVLRAGIDVFQSETIDTADNSASRVVFQDRTELSIGPMSQVVLDRFVFDPNPAASAVAVSLAKGVARFSTGMLPKPDYTIRTPSCGIGVRGTVLTAIVSAERASSISVQEGAATVTAQGVTVVVNAGQSTYVPFGKPPSQPFTSPPQPPSVTLQMDALLQSAPPAYPPGGAPPPSGSAPAGYPPGGNYPPPGGEYAPSGTPYGGPGYGGPGFGFGGNYGGGFGGGDRGGGFGGSQGSPGGNYGGGRGR